MPFRGNGEAKLRGSKEAAAAAERRAASGEADRSRRESGIGRRTRSSRLGAPSSGRHAPREDPRELDSRLRQVGHSASVIPLRGRARRRPGRVRTRCESVCTRELAISRAARTYVRTYVRMYVDRYVRAAPVRISLATLTRIPSRALAVRAGDARGRARSSRTYAGVPRPRAFTGP